MDLPRNSGVPRGPLEPRNDDLSSKARLIMKNNQKNSEEKFPLSIWLPAPVSPPWRHRTGAEGNKSQQPDTRCVYRDAWAPVLLNRKMKRPVCLDCNPEPWYLGYEAIASGLSRLWLRIFRKQIVDRTRNPTEIHAVSLNPVCISK